jgi:hypothetical protein
MGNVSQYFLDGPNLQSASAAFDDQALTQPAADGYYADGTTVRQQLNGIFVSNSPCQECTQECNTTVNVVNAGQGFYVAPFNLGAAVGVSRVVINPNTCAKGVRYQPNNLSAINSLSSQNDGYLNNTSGGFSVIGSSVDPNCGNPVPGSYSVGNYVLDNNVFVQAAGTTNIVYAAGNDVLSPTLAGPGDCVGYYSKSSTAPITLDLQIVDTGSSLSNFSISIECPVLLTPSPYGADCGDECESAMYNVPVNGFPGVIGLYDWVFQDNLATAPMINGQYYICNINSIIDVSTDGVVTAINQCAVQSIKCYTIGNTDLKVAISVGYTDENGAPQTLSLPAATTQTICAYLNSVSSTAPTFTLSGGTQDCGPGTPCK